MKKNGGKTMTTLIRNIGSLDARWATRETIEQITKIKNIGSLIVNKENKSLFIEVNMENVGATVEMDLDVKLHIGPMKFTRELLESAPTPIKLSIVGPVSFSMDITPELIMEKLEWLQVTGPIEVYENISGILMSKVNDSVGPIDIIRINEIVLKRKNTIDNNYLKSLQDDSVLTCSGTLELSEDLDIDLFNLKVKRIKIGNKLSIYDDQKDIIMRKIYEEFEETKTETKIGIKPTLFVFKENYSNRLDILKRNYQYFPESTKLDAFNLMNVKKDVICSNGVLVLGSDISNELLEEKEIQFSSSKRIYFPQELSKNMMKYLINDTQGVPYNSDSTSFINNEQIITNSRIKIIKDNSCFIVFGDLKISDEISFEDLNSKFATIDNYGSIEANSDACSILQDKLRYNEGSIGKGESEGFEDEEDISKYDHVIQNAGSYQL